MKRYKVILTESEMRKLNEVRRDVRAKRLVLNDDDIDTKDEDDFITVNHINKSNYKKYIGRKVNVTGDVYLEKLGLKEIPITFGTVGGDFYCYDNELTSLSGCPHKVGGYFDCSYNNLTSLAGCPSEVGGSFYCCNDRLTSLSGCPHKVGGNFDCSNNKKQFTINNIKRFCKVGGDIFN